MRFVIDGVPYDLDPNGVIERVRRTPPEPVRVIGVRIDGVIYPVKQAFEAAIGLPRAGFTSHTARRHLAALGFDITGPEGPDAQAGSAERHDDIGARLGPGRGPDFDPYARDRWPWEGSVQAVFVNLLRDHGWSIVAEADTTTKAPGVDVIAVKGDRRLGAEVKGWPSEGYADLRRAGETKPTRPSTQAGHWFSQALFKAIMLLDSHSGHESLMVLPDYSRYRNLADRTRTGRRAATIHLVLLTPDGHHTSGTWTP